MSSEGNGEDLPRILPGLPGLDPDAKRTNQTEKALEQYRRRLIEDYEVTARKMIALAHALKRNGAQAYVYNDVAHAALLLSEIYVARREGVIR